MNFVYNFMFVSKIFSLSLNVCVQGLGTTESGIHAV
jgi:hypothetical protein